MAHPSPISSMPPPNPFAWSEQIATEIVIAFFARGFTWQDAPQEANYPFRYSQLYAGSGVWAYVAERLDNAEEQKVVLRVHVSIPVGSESADCPIELIYARTSNGMETRLFRMDLRFLNTPVRRDRLLPLFMAYATSIRKPTLSPAQAEGILNLIIDLVEEAARQ